MSTDFLKLIEHQMPGFSKGQRAIARYLLEHYEKAAFMTASKLGATVGVSESTVVRFASEVGCDGYPQLQKRLQEIIRNRLTAVQRIEITSEQMSRSDVVSKVLQADVDRIKSTLEHIDMDSFNAAVDCIIKAKTIYILGVRSSGPLASFLAYYMNLIFDNVKLVQTNSISETFEQMLKIGPEDVMIGISFPRYSKRTVKAMDFAKSREASVIAITDSHHSPIAASADCVLKAHGNMVSFVDSMVGPLSLLNALVVALSMSRQDEVKQNLESLENIWKEYDVYESVGDDSDTFGKILS